MTNSPHMTADFILERLEAIGGSAHPRESGNETAERMLAYLASHKKGNEEEMKHCLLRWIEEKTEPKLWIAKYLLKKLEL
jgi:hypothetical protein